MFQCHRPSLPFLPFLFAGRIATASIALGSILCLGSCDAKDATGPIIPPDAAIQKAPSTPVEPPGRATENGQEGTTTGALETPPYNRIGWLNAGAHLPTAKGITILAIDPVTGDVGCASLATEAMCASRMAAVRPGVGAVAMAGNTDGSWLKLALDQLAKGKIANAGKSLEETSGSGRRLITLFDVKGEGLTIKGASVKTHVDFNISRGDNCLVAMSGPSYQSVADDALKRFQDNKDQPLAARLLLALGSSMTENAFAKLRSAALVVQRPANGASTGPGPIVDLRVEYHGAPYQRLLTLYDVALKAQIGPRLVAIQKRTDTQSPAYQRNRAWLSTIRNGTSIHQKD